MDSNELQGDDDNDCVVDCESSEELFIDNSFKGSSKVSARSVPGFRTFQKPKHVVRTRRDINILKTKLNKLSAMVGKTPGEDYCALLEQPE